MSALLGDPPPVLAESEADGRAGLDAVVRLRGITRVFPGPPSVTALADVELRIDAGEYVAIVGPSGSGKSTMLHLLGLLDTPTAGEYQLDGVDICGLSEVRRAALRGARIGFVFQAFHLLDHRTVLENVMLSGLYQGVSRGVRQRRAEDGLRQLGLGHRLDAYPSSLSGGEQQRVAIARALVHSPSLLLADEPTGNLDSANTAAVLDVLDRLHDEGVTIVVITHDLDVAARADRRVEIRDGLLAEERQRVVDAVTPPSRPVDGAPVGSRLSVAALLGEMSAASAARPLRTALTALGTVLGVGALVATLGFAKTASNQIVSRFDRLEATEVTVSPSVGTASVSDTGSVRTSPIPFDAESRLRRLEGVRSVGTESDVSLGAQTVRTTDALGADAGLQLPVVAVSPGLFDAAHATVATGRTFDRGHDRRGDAVAVLGPAAAARLNVTRVDDAPAIFIGDDALTVVGILRGVRRQPELLGAVIVPNGLARERWGLEAPSQVLIDVAVGAADLIGREAPIALVPNDPSDVVARVPSAPRRVRSDVRDDVNSLFLVLGAILLLVGAVGIANVTLVSVLERRSEIGLRRALGATRRHVATQFLGESAAIGAVAGIIGTSLGVLAVVVIAATRTWTPIVDPWLPVVAPLIGAVTGLLAGTFPAYKASKVEPISSLRGVA